MRTVDVATLTQNIKEMCIEANHFLSEDMKTAFTKAEQQEKAPLGKQILQQLQQNMDIAGKDMIPICQDTGMAVVFLEVGQDVHLTMWKMPSTKVSDRDMWTVICENLW